jgi:hypothetical protein
VCVDCTLSLLGRRAMRGIAASTMLVAGASVVKKWLVAPELKMAHCLSGSIDINCFEEDGGCKGIVVGWGSGDDSY